MMDAITRTMMGRKVLETVAVMEKGNLLRNALRVNVANRLGMPVQDLDEVIEDLKSRDLIETGMTLNDYFIRLKSFDTRQ